MSEETTEVSEPQGGDMFNMEGAVEAISDDLFPGKDVEAEEISDDEEEAVVEAKEKQPDKVEKEIKQELDGAMLDAIDLPPSWKKDMQDRWGKIDADTQKYVIQREKEMHEGLEKDRGDADLGRLMRDTMTPYEALFDERDIDAPQAVKYLLQNHYALSKGTNEQKIELLNQLARSYGINTKGSEKPDSQVTSLTQRLESVENNINASHQRTLQATTTRIETEVNAFADEHPLFDDLKDDIAKFISAGDDLDEAYERALWANPVTRVKEMDRLKQEEAKVSQKQEKLETEEAKKAQSVNVKGLDTKKSPTAKKGKMFDDMPDMYREIQNRN